ncbi:MAG: peptidyl-prolyl cis-trans isomerase [Bdellovibrionales bacterium]|nr:peptidyl-prolyl cis-trans isomerase [Bdellovibrionales bacterium]
MIKTILITLSICFSFNSMAKNASTSKKEEKVNPVVEMKTSLGTMEIELDQEKAPKTVENFLNYTKKGFYNETIFHRVISGFMIQGGGFTAGLKQKDTDKSVENEAKNGLKNKRGTIAMARTQAPHSATAQFFINHKDNDNLDYPSFDGWGYAVFGKVVKGDDVIDKIAAVKTTTKGQYQNVPVEDVKIEYVKVINK